MANKTGRTERLIVPTTVNEKRAVDQAAKEAKLNTSDYVRSKLGISLARGKRNRYETAPPEPLGDPDNAVDVEELAKELYEFQEIQSPMTMGQARADAKRRLELAATERI